MTVIYMVHPTHGAKVAISNEEANLDAMDGWERYDVVTSSVVTDDDEDEIVNEPEPLPREVVLKHKTIALGKTKFTEFIQSWMAGIDYETMGLIEGVAQPNRELLLRDLCNSPFAHPTLEYVRSCGGLQRAIFDVTQDRYLARRLPDFIVPPASIVFSDLSDTYEYTNPWKDED